MPFNKLRLVANRSSGDREEGFGSTGEYLKYLAGQDCEQVAGQLNSVSGPFGAKSDYATFNALRNLAPDMVNTKYDQGPFKLICDDLGLANLILRSKDDMIVVGVVDLEWSYVGPAQMAASAPWWLVQDRPTNEDWECKNDEPPSLASRYFRYLDLYKRVLREEEERRAGHGAKEFSSFVQWSEDSGAMWLHMLLSGGFNREETFPFHQLRRHIGADKWAGLQPHLDKGEMDAFARQKILHLEQHDAEEDEMLNDKERVESGELSRLGFVERYRRLLLLGSRKWSEGDLLPDCNAYGEMMLG